MISWPTLPFRFHVSGTTNTQQEPELFEIVIRAQSIVGHTPNSVPMFPEEKKLNGVQSRLMHGGHNGLIGHQFLLTKWPCV